MIGMLLLLEKPLYKKLELWDVNMLTEGSDFRNIDYWKIYEFISLQE